MKKTGKKINLLMVLKIIGVICVAIIFLEVVYLIYAKVSTDNKNTYYDGLNSIAKIDDGYIAVGSSDFKNSRGNKWTKGYEKGKLAKYDDKQNLLWEKEYVKGYNSTFLDVAILDNGYVAVGNIEGSKEQNKDGVRDAFIVKYDEEGKIIAEQKFQILGDSKFTKVKVVKDGIYVIGQSIFPPMELGISNDGGGVLVKYDFDLNEIFRSNFGGSKSGIFNDFVISGDSIYAVGKDASKTGLLVKYDLNGNRQWIKNYSYTDVLGFSSIAEYKNELIVVGAKKVTDNNDDYDTDGLLVKYDKDGKLLMDKSFTVNERIEEKDSVVSTSVSMDRFNSLVVDDKGNILIAGQVAVKDEEESTDKLNVFRYSGLFLKYSIDGKLIDHVEIGGSRDDYFTDIMRLKNNYLIIGYSNSKDEALKGTGRNGKDYKSLFITVDDSGKIKSVK